MSITILTDLLTEARDLFSRLLVEQKRRSYLKAAKNTHGPRELSDMKRPVSGYMDCLWVIWVMGPVSGYMETSRVGLFRVIYI